MSAPRVHKPRVAGVIYCLGFLFTEDRSDVVLIEKARPDWQRGKFNGIGGHVEAGETPLAAMIREAGEEAYIAGVDWRHFATMRGAAWECFCYRAFDTAEAKAAKGGGDGDEKIFLVPLHRRHTRPLLPNLGWLIPLALDEEIRGVTTVEYCVSPPETPPSDEQSRVLAPETPRQQT